MLRENENLAIKLVKFGIEQCKTKMRMLGFDIRRFLFGGSFCRFNVSIHPRRNQTKAVSWARIGIAPIVHLGDLVRVEALRSRHSRFGICDYQ